MVDELKARERTIQELEERCDQVDSAQAQNKRSAALIRSLETQLKASEQFIVKLKKENKDLEKELSSNEGGAFTRKPPSKSSTSSNKTTREPAPQPTAVSNFFDSSDCDSGPLTESHLDVENKAEQIFQRSRSTRANLRRSLIVMPTQSEEPSSTASEEECSFKKTYSLRQRSERRRSFQPRRYMGGHTPPSKRTFVGDPRQAQISMFNTETAEEPEVDYDWGRIASIRGIGEVSCFRELSRQFWFVKVSVGNNHLLLLPFGTFMNPRSGIIMDQICTYGRILAGCALFLLLTATLMWCW